MIDKVFDVGIELVEKIRESQSKNIDKASKLIADTIEKGNNVYVTGSGHSHTFALELYGRAGVLANFIPILTSELTLTEHPTKSSYIERLPGYAKILVDLYGVKKDDVVIVVSNSGINSYPVEMCEEAHNNGAKVIAITNIEHSSKAKSRAKSGNKLMDIGDIVIDNCGVFGDAILDLDGIEETVFPTSSISNAFISQAINVQTCVYLKEKGIDPAVFISANREDIEGKNEQYYKKYTRLY